MEELPAFSQSRIGVFWARGKWLLYRALERSAGYQRRRHSGRRGMDSSGAPAGGRRKQACERQQLASPQRQVSVAPPRTVRSQYYFITFLQGCLSGGVWRPLKTDILRVP